MLAGGDASTDAPASTSVAITAYTFKGDGAPDPTAIAIFSDASGATIQHGLVDADGHAQCDLADGGSITVLQVTHDPTNLALVTDHLTSFRDVAPGDHLVVGRTRDPAYRAGATDAMTLSYTPLSSSSGPYIYAQCVDGGSGNGPLTLTFHASCETPAFDLLLFADDTSGVRNYIWRPGVAHVASGTIAIPNTWQPIARTATTVTNARTGALLAVELDVVLGGTAFLVDSANTPPFALAFAPVATPTLLTAWQTQGVKTIDRQVVVTTGSPMAVAIDMASLPLPAPAQARQNAAGLTWTETVGGNPDARAIVWSSTWIDGNQANHSAVWQIIEKPTPATSATLPALPTDYAEDDPTFADPQRSGHVTGAAIFYVDYDNLDGYAAARAAGASIIDIESQFLSIDHRAHYTVAGTN